MEKVVSKRSPRTLSFVQLYEDVYFGGGVAVPRGWRCRDNVVSVGHVAASDTNPPRETLSPVPSVTCW